MSIDADLRSSIIDAEEAKRRRSVVERESQLYGSFDGAMKFIKGDAIASIIIIFINFIGGISVGISQHHMDFSHALATYTILTVGDGLVAQIPALLIAVAAGFVVTRVNGDNENLGRTIINQLLTNPLILVVNKSVIENLKKENISAKLKNKFYLDYGINLPDIIISDSDDLEENTIVLLINEIKADQFYIRYDGYRLINKTDEIEHLGIEKITINNDIWINETDYEKISIKNMKLIMETIAQWAPKEKDVILFVKHIRSALGRYICHKFLRGNNLNIILLSNENEEVIRSNIRNTSAGAFLNLEPKESEYLLDKISLALDSMPLSYNDFVILCSVDIRRFLKKFVENKFNNVDVISFGELTETVSVNVLRTI